MQWKTSIVFTFSPSQGVSFFRPLKSEQNFRKQKMNTIVFWGADFTKGSKPGYPKTENSTDLSHYFFGGGGTQLHFRNKTHTNVRLAISLGIPPNHRKYGRRWYFYVEEKCAYLMYMKVVFKSNPEAYASNFGKLLGFRRKFWNFGPHR